MFARACPLEAVLIPCKYGDVRCPTLLLLLKGGRCPMLQFRQRVGDAECPRVATNRVSWLPPCGGPFGRERLGLKAGLSRRMGSFRALLHDLSG
mmetsp:Transcript_127021/g.247506  ORF Transcript_127021/g.247506 Transcript_127021/m.247506 type:complete len:94 (+) Transcript_127021:1503-1784(+)